VIPFPGESAPLDWANVTAGTPFADEGDAIRLRAGSATVVAGDAFVVGFYDHHYLEAGADAVFSAVVETLAGSSGVLRLSGGPDATWDLDDGPASVYDLGDHTVTGASTIVVPLPWVTVADYLDEDVETAVRVECLSGSVVVQQVKLRIWPPAGVVGGWSADPFVQAPQDKNPDIANYVGRTITDLMPTQSGFRAALADLTTGAVAAGGFYITGGQMYASSDESTPVGVSGGFGAAYVRRLPGGLSGPGFDEEGWIYPPAEVWTDDDRVVFQPTGPDSFVWLQPVATVATGGGELDGLFHIDTAEVDEHHPAGTTYVSFVVGTNLGTVGHTGTDTTFTDLALPEFDAPHLLVTIWHDGHFADIAETGGAQARLTYGQTVDEVEWDRLLYRWTPAPYRYWNPAAVVVTKLRQLHRDDGLGVAPPRAFGGASRIRTGRAYGYD